MTSLLLDREHSAGRSPTAERIQGGWAEAVLGFAQASHARACTLLVLLSLVCFLPGFVSLQPMDRDEPRFAQASKQMLESGDYVDIRFQDEARHKKPVGIYWLQSAAVAVAERIGFENARTTIAFYRLPSLAGAIATVLLTYWAALAFARRREAFLAAAFMGASVILAVEARLAKTDAVLAACCVAAMGALARAYFSRGVARLNIGTILIFWVALAVGILIKGPIILLFTGLCALALSIRERSGRWLLGLRPGLGAALVMLIAGPWFAAIAWKAGADFFAASAGHDLIGKVGAAQTQHWAPPGTYLLVFFGTFWPAAILAAIAAPFAWINRREDEIAFILAWVIPAWLVFEAVPTKLPHYVMPLYPAIAILLAIALARGFVGPHRPYTRATTVLIPAIPLALALGLPFAALALGDGVPLMAAPVLLAAAALAFVAWRQFVRGAAIAASLTAVASAMVLCIGVFGLAQPLMRSLKISPRLAVVAQSVTCPEPRVATLGYREPSLVFLVGTDLAMVESGAQAARFLGEGGCRVAFVERRFEPDFRAALSELPVQPALVTRVGGFNINGGRRLDIGAYVMAP